jgi:hypothetical protein
VWWRINRTGSDPFLWTVEAADGRWQTGSVVRAFYLADTEATAWAEWYRHTSEQGAPPASRMPRDTWTIAVNVSDIADLADPDVLERHGIAELRPTRRQWPVTQPVGEAFYRAGFRGLLAPSAARDAGARSLRSFVPCPRSRACPRSRPRTVTTISHRSRRVSARRQGP